MRVSHSRVYTFPIPFSYMEKTATPRHYQGTPWLSFLLLDWSCLANWNWSLTSENKIYRQQKNLSTAIVTRHLRHLHTPSDHLGSLHQRAQSVNIKQECEFRSARQLKKVTKQTPTDLHTVGLHSHGFHLYRINQAQNENASVLNMYRHIFVIIAWTIKYNNDWNSIYRALGIISNLQMIWSPSEDVLRLHARTPAFHVRGLGILGCWYPWEVLEPAPMDTQGRLHFQISWQCIIHFYIYLTLPQKKI